MKGFVIDLTKCVGCYDCQIGCKDEHCGNCWLPYADEQPDTGQFWLHLLETERGKAPHVKVTYLPLLCQHCENAPCIKAAKDNAVYRREDGLVIIDPVKAKGQKQIVASCPYHVIYWNEEKQIPQKCTGCAHLLDGGHAISTPRCVDNCHMNAIQFGEMDELDLTDTELLHPEYGTHPHVFYRGLPKRFVAGKVYDPESEEVVIGAVVRLKNENGSYTTRTDAFGDFWLRSLPEDDFTLTITGGGKSYTAAVSTKAEDVGLGSIALA